MSLRMDSTYLSPFPQFLQASAYNNNGSILVNLDSVGIPFLLLSALLSGLLLQHTLHGTVCFTGCKRSDPSVLAAGKWRSLTEILMTTGTHLEKKTDPASTTATFTVVTLHKHPLLLLLLEQPANVQ